VSSAPLTVRPGGRLLVVKTSSLGDVIHATPCLRAIRRSLPEAEVAMAVDRRFVAVVAHNPHLDAVVETLPSLRGPLRLPWGAILRLLREARPDAALDLQGTCGSAALVYASRARWRGGRGGTRPGWQLVCRPDLDRHAVRVCAEIATAAGIAVSDLAPEVFLSTGDDEALLAALRERRLPVSDFVLVNPFSRWPSKAWPLERYAQLIVAVRAQHPVPVVIVGDRDEVLAADRLIGLLPTGAATSLAGVLPLGQALCLYRRALLMVTGDSGPMHAAAALGTPVIALFGPTLPERTGPWGEGHVVIQERRPTSHHAYRRDRDGTHIRAIAVDRVAAAVTAAVASLRHSGNGLRRAAPVIDAEARRRPA
jgi:ADP-heptose:LPS heptosyltransferase